MRQTKNCASNGAADEHECEWHIDVGDYSAEKRRESSNCKQEGVRNAKRSLYMPLFDMVFFRPVYQVSQVKNVSIPRTRNTESVNARKRPYTVPYTLYIRSVYDHILAYYMDPYYGCLSPWPYTEKYGEKWISYTDRFSP